MGWSSLSSRVCAQRTNSRTMVPMMSMAVPASVYGGREGAARDLGQDDQAETGIRLEGSLLAYDTGFGDDLRGARRFTEVPVGDVRQWAAWCGERPR